MHLTLKAYDYIFTKNFSKLPFLEQVPSFRKHFWTHITIGSSSMLVWEDVEKISEIFTV